MFKMNQVTILGVTELVPLSIPLDAPHRRGRLKESGRRSQSQITIFHPSPKTARLGQPLRLSSGHEA